MGCCCVKYLREDLEARSRGIRDGDTILLQCQTGHWSWSANNWLGFDGDNNMRCGSNSRARAVPLTLHAVSGQPHTYTIESEGGWLGREGIQMKANQPREHAARVRFGRSWRGRVTLLCVDNNRYISHRSSGGWMVATYGNGGQGTEGDVDYHLVVTGSISTEEGLRRCLAMDRARVREAEARLEEAPARLAVDRKRLEEKHRKRVEADRESLEAARERVQETEARLAALASQAEQEMPAMREAPVERPGFTRKLSSFLFGEQEPVAESEAEPQAEAWYGEQEPGAKQIVEGVVVETEH